MANDQTTVRHRSSNSTQQEYVIVDHTPSYPSPAEAARRRQALQKATSVASLAVATTLIYFAYRFWCGLSRTLSRDASHACSAWVEWLFLLVEIGFSCKYPYILFSSEYNALKSPLVSSFSASRLTGDQAGEKLTKVSIT